MEREKKNIKLTDTNEGPKKSPPLSSRGKKKKDIPKKTERVTKK